MNIKEANKIVAEYDAQTAENCDQQELIEAQRVIIESYKRPNIVSSKINRGNLIKPIGAKSIFEMSDCEIKEYTDEVAILNNLWGEDMGLVMPVLCLHILRECVIEIKKELPELRRYISVID